MNKPFALALLIAFLSISFSSFTDSAKPQGYTLIEDQASVPILTPSFADRTTAKILLNNGLEAFIVSDPNTDKSAAALIVKVGSWEEPKEYPGMAHFLEHMLFLGTKKYPNESDYQTYIAENDGSANAFTTDYYTAYMFSINNQALEGALDRFSYFFKEPLFNPSGVAREMQAIDQEYAKNVENDDFRELYVLKTLANPEHPFHAFSMGNSSSLSKVSQDALKAWYHSHYSANLMRLIVYSSLPLDQLIKIVVNDFKDVPTNNHTSPIFDAFVFSPETVGHMIYVEPIKDERKISLLWELPTQFAHMQESKPESIICHVLGHEGKESLLAALKKEKLAEELSCGSQRLGSDRMIFFLEIDLTEIGLKNVDTVIERCFQAIAIFKKKGVPQHLFDEIKRMATIRYQYQEREDLFYKIMKQVTWLADEPMETFPQHTLIVQKFNPQDIKAFLDFLTPQNCRFELIAPPSVTGVKTEHVEPWLKVPYAIKSISATKLAKWADAKPLSQIALPTPNQLIPAQLSLINPNLPKPTTLIPHPKLIIDDKFSKIYFAQDARYNIPKISWFFRIKTPQVDAGDAAKVVLADLYVKSVTDALSNYSYYATLAEINYDIDKDDFGIKFNVDGYSENAPLLFGELLKYLKDPSATEQKFKIYKDTLLRDYQNKAKEMPLMQASEILKTMVYKSFTSSKEKVVAIRKINFEQFQEYVANLFEQSFVEGMFYGNLTEDQAKMLAKNLNKALDSKPYPKEDQKSIEVIVIPDKQGPFYLDSKIKSQGNAVILAIEDPNFSFQTRAAQQVMMQAIEQPFFDTLRTKQQTGYLVFSTDEEIERKLFNFFGVQSNTHDPRDLLARFELFIEGFLQELPIRLSEERFEIYKLALLTTLKQPPKNPKEMAELLFKFAFKYQGDFDWLTKRIDGLEKLSYQEFLETTKNFLGKTNKRRLAVLLKGITPEEKIIEYFRLRNAAEIRKVSVYQNAK